MTYRWLDDLGLALGAAGIAYTPVGPSGADPTGAADWSTRGRPASAGAFDPSGVLCHHTASPAGTADANELGVILAGNSEAPGPISQLLIGRSTTVYVVAAGRANHAGTARIAHLGMGCVDGNANLVGVEVANNGTGERWADPLCDVYARVVGALCAWYGWPLDRVYLHATTGPPCGNSKIDPAGPWTAQPELAGGGAGTWDLATWRNFIADRSTTGDDDMAVKQYLWRSPRYFNTWLIGACAPTYVANNVYNDLVGAGVPVMIEDNEIAVASYLAVCAMTRADLVADGSFKG